MPQKNRIYMETGATHLGFHQASRRRRWPLVVSVVVIGSLALGFATYPGPSATGFFASKTSDGVGTVRPAAERTGIEIAGIGPGDFETSEHKATGKTETADSIREFPGSTQNERSGGPPHKSSPIRHAGAARPGPDLNATGLDWKEHVVEPGDHLSGIFSKLEIHSQLRPILALDDEITELDRIFPGERLSAGTKDGQLQILLYQPRGDYHIEITRNGNDGNFFTQRKEHDLETRRRLVQAEIQQSLFLDGSRAGLSDGLLVQIADIFGWDFDFAWDIRQGDRLIVLYDRIFKDGEYLRDGPVLAAEFQSGTRTITALRFTPEAGEADYFTPDGHRMRRAFIRTPVDVGRISSSFGPRKHPVLGYTRQHQGVDYAAPTGTPIRAAGDGRIVHRGTRGGYGNTVIIDHGDDYKTLYAHMNGFRRGQSVGSHVRQGEIIGYVGMTGLATGPHLHYEFHVRNEPVNPVTVDLPKAAPLPRKYREAFRNQTAPMLAAIEGVRETQLAEGATGTGAF